MKKSPSREQRMRNKGCLKAKVTLRAFKQGSFFSPLKVLIDIQATVKNQVQKYLL
jgi:hypothetical protein